MSRFYLEFDPPAEPPHAFGGSSDVLVSFISLAFSTRYGSIHPLSQLALLLRGEYKINMTPLTTFADRNVEEEADQIELDRVWQDAAPLAETLAQINGTLASADERITRLTEETPDLRARLLDLQRMIEWAAGREARVRMTFEL